MGLWEFLRQWQGSRHATGITVSIVVHALLLAALFTNNPFFAMSKPGPKPGDALIVDLKSEPAPAAPGNASPPPAAPPQAPAPRAVPAPARPSPPPRAKPAQAAATPTPAPVNPARPEAPPRVASAPAPVASTPVPVPSAPPSPPAPPAPEPPAPQVTDTAGTVPVPAAPAPSRPPEATAPSSAPPASSPSTPAAATERQVASAPPAVSAPSGQAYVPDVRSLRPGAGGAHGALGSGRGGIEGDPVALDNPDPRYGDYLARVKLAIERNMIYPCVKDPHGRCDYKPAQLLIEFGIKKDGNLAFIEVRQPATYQIFDEYSANAVKLATFPPMPEALRRIHPTGLPIVARFRYETTLSLNSIIR